MEHRKQIGLPSDIDLSKYKLIFGADGDCMNSPEAPIQIKNGQRLKVHGYDGVFCPFADIDKVRGKVCVVQYITQGKRYFAVKEITGIDEITGRLKMAYYYPQKTSVSLSVEAIEKVYFVDGVEE